PATTNLRANRRLRSFRAHRSGRAVGARRPRRSPQGGGRRRRHRASVSLEDVGRLLISCPDRPGIVAAVSHFLFDRGANIIRVNEHSSERGGGTFFMRLEFRLEELASTPAALEQAFKPIAGSVDMDWRLAPAAQRKRLAVFVSRAEHALLELLWQQRAGD